MRIKIRQQAPGFIFTPNHRISPRLSGKQPKSIDCHQLETGEVYEKLREINGQDHQTSMGRIRTSICSIWSRSLRSSECIAKQYSIAIVHGINKTSSKIIKIQNNEFSDRPRKCTFCSRTLHMANDAAESNI